MRNPELNRGGVKPRSKSRVVSYSEFEMYRLRSDVKEMQYIIRALSQGAVLDRVRMFVFEGGRPPERKTEHANAFDAYARAIVSKQAPCPGNVLRDCRADFRKTPGWKERVDMALHIIDDPSNPDKYGIRLLPGERCMVGLGFATVAKLARSSLIGLRHHLISFTTCALCSFIQVSH